MRKPVLYSILIIWVIMITGSFSLNIYLIQSSTNEIVINKAEAFFEQIVVTRAWNAQHGGVYVPVTKKTQPNLYLKDSLRDIITIDGMELTKINPAFMTRQIADLNKTTYNLQFHITSLNPIRPANKADEWETKALLSFEEDNTELLELIKTNSSSKYKYMAPLITQQSCLKCHAEQGYKLGDIRGGISISFPSIEYLASQYRQLLSLFIGHLLVLIMGITGMIVYYRMSNKYFSVLIEKNTELKKKETLLHEKNSNLQELNAKKDKFFSIIAHDLKAPFNSIIGFSELMLDKRSNFDNEKIKTIISSINKTSKNSFKLLENLLNWALSETNQLKYSPKTYNLYEIVTDCIQLLHSSADNKEITIINHITESTMIHADKNMLNTILQNLISNAIKFTKPGGEIELYVIQDNNRSITSIKDNGVGMGTTQIDNLFNIEKAESTYGTEQERGTGLGLILCKEFIQKHGGEIWVKSTLNSGSEFSFSIPN